MVVLAAAVCSKKGKAIVSRHFVDMSRLRIESLLSSFPKLLNSERQHTYAETESVRYVYQPVDSLYVVCITNKASNIIEDLDTVRLLAKLVPEIAGVSDEDSVRDAAFDIIFAFDEAIAAGYRENVTIPQIHTNLEMDSHEEKLWILEQKQKEKEAEEERKRRQAEIEARRASGVPMRGGLGMGSMGSGFSNEGGADRDASIRAAGGALFESSPGSATARSGGFGAGSMGSNSGGVSGGMKLGKGMKLEKSRKRDDFLQAMAREGEITAAALGGNAAAAQASTTVNVAAEPLSIHVRETIAAALNRDGGVESVEVKGDLVLCVNQDAYARLHLSVADHNAPGFQVTSHPKIDKKRLAAESVLALRDPSQPFPVGADIGVLKWRAVTSDDGVLPLLVNCWPSSAQGQSIVNIEFELQRTEFTLTDVQIVIPVPPGDVSVSQIDGSFAHDRTDSVLVWSVEVINNENANGSLEFAVQQCPPESFFPVEIRFASETTFMPVHVAEAVQSESGQPIRFASARELRAKDYRVV